MESLDADASYGLNIHKDYYDDENGLKPNNYSEYNNYIKINFKKKSQVQMKKTEDVMYMKQGTINLFFIKIIF